MEKKGTKGTIRDKLPADRLRRTIIMLEEDSDYIDRIAHWERKYIMEAIHEMVDMHRRAYVKKHKKLPDPIPARRTKF